MSFLLSVIIALLIIGAVLYLVSLAPVDGRIKQAINVIVIIAVIVWLLQLVMTQGFPAFGGR